MKKTLFVTVLALLALCLAASCDKVGDQVIKLEGKVNGLTSVHGQITTMQASVNDLSKMNETFSAEITKLNGAAGDVQVLVDDLRADMDVTEEYNSHIGALEGQVAKIKTQVAALQKQETDMNATIDGLNADLEPLYTKEDAKKVFVTIEKWQAAVGKDMTRIKDGIEMMDSTLAESCAMIDNFKEIVDAEDNVTRDKLAAFVTTMESVRTELADLIDTKITDCEESIKSWMSNELTGYYTSGEIDAKITALDEKYQQLLAASDEAHKAEIEALKDTIEPLRVKLDTMVAQVERAYKAAVKISTDSLSFEINANKTAIERIDASLDSLDAKVVTVKTRIETFEKRIAVLKKMVQSIVFVPEYQGGAIVVTYTLNKANIEETGKVDTNISASSVDIRYQVMPAAAAANISGNSKIMVKITSYGSAATVTEVTIDSVTDEGDGIVKVTISLTEDMKSAIKDPNRGVSVCLVVNDTAAIYDTAPGITNISSAYTRIIGVETVYR